MGLLPGTYNCGLCMRREWRERFPRHWLQRKPIVSDRDMLHDTCVTHVPGCMSGSPTRECGKRSWQTKCMRNPWIYVSGKRPIGHPRQIIVYKMSGSPTRECGKRSWQTKCMRNPWIYVSGERPIGHPLQINGDKIVPPHDDLINPGYDIRSTKLNSKSSLNKFVLVGNINLDGDALPDLEHTNALLPNLLLDHI